MRTWIFNRVRAIAGLPAGMGFRVISSGAADNPEPPFIVVNMGVEQPVPGMPASMGVQTIPFTVWVHDTPGSMLNIDEACVLIKDALPTPDGAAVGGMFVYECRWVGTGDDAYDDHYSTNTRPVRFDMTTHR